MSTPSKLIAAAGAAPQAAASRITASAVIDLPEPDSPTSPMTSPGATERSTALQDRRAADRQRQVLDLEQAHRRAPRARVEDVGDAVAEQVEAEHGERRWRMPGKSASHGATIISVCASNSMRPQLGIGGWAPSPT